MRFGFWPGAGSSWDDTLELCRHVEATGWDTIWYADHFMPNVEDPVGPTNESWTFIAAIAATVPRIRIGHLVNGNTYRYPPVTAKMAAGVDQISGGRFILGLGAGWQENEHAAYDIPFFDMPERLRRLDEACQIITGLFNDEKTSLDGRYYKISDAPLNPKPVQSPLPIMIGGGGEKVTLKITAKYANEWNVWGAPEVLEQKMAILDQHCADVGRDPAEIQRSAAAMLTLSDDPEVVEKAAAGGRPVIAGNAEQVQAIVRRYADIGVDEIIIPDFNMGESVDEKKAVADRFMNEVGSTFR